ncbi:general stress protein [Peribacillus alkalitolerans]|uniref:general stress protein n=1 Tax=Peribacillus alkalitolerans TaxID=1550385 RepID=UPI0013CFB6B0|nr:general stress protein [Peribacillus alkalitolerans]
MSSVYVVENGVQAKEKVEQLTASGHTKENIYVFTHDKSRSEHLTDLTNTENVGMKEQGLFDSVGNLFRSRGDELRTKMTSLGLSQAEAEKYEKELDYGKVVVVATNGDAMNGHTTGI